MTLNRKNYTEDQTAELVNLYKNGSTPEALAEQFARSVKSVVAKLSREGVYIPKSDPKSQKATRTTKATLITKLEQEAQLEAGSLATLEKASKEALELLVSKLVFSND